MESNKRITKYLVESNPFSKLPRKLFLLYAPLKVLFQVVCAPRIDSRSFSFSFSSLSRHQNQISTLYRIHRVFQHWLLCGLLPEFRELDSSSIGTTLDIQFWAYPLVWIILVLDTRLINTSCYHCQMHWAFLRSTKWWESLCHKSYEKVVKRGVEHWGIGVIRSCSFDVP